MTHKNFVLNFSLLSRKKEPPWLSSHCLAKMHLKQYYWPQTCLQDPSVAYLIIQDAKNEIIANDWKHILLPVHTLHLMWSPHLKASHPAGTAIGTKLLEYGIRGTKLIQNLYCYLSRPRSIFGERKCPLRSAHIVVGQSYPLHLFPHYLEQFNLDTVILWLENKNFSELFKLAEPISSLHFNDTHRLFWNFYYCTGIQLSIVSAPVCCLLTCV